MRKWRIEDSAELYNITGWGVNYFAINEKGNVVVTPKKNGVAVDLKELVEELLIRDVSAPMLYGGAASGKKVFTSSSSPGISLMAEGLTYLAGAELPCLVVNVVRGGPGLGTIQPAQSDYFQAVKGGGHELILETLEKVKYNKTKAALLLNIDRKTLYNKMRQYNIDF